MLYILVWIRFTFCLKSEETLKLKKGKWNLEEDLKKKKLQFLFCSIPIATNTAFHTKFGIDATLIRIC